MRRGTRLRRLGAGLAAALLLSGCAQGLHSADQVNRPEDKPVVVGTGLRMQPVDPAAAVTAGEQAFVLATYQRLLTLNPGTSFLKPDAAAECMFLNEKTYSCSLRDGISFSNGRKLQATDVKYSIDRARKLAEEGKVPGSSASQLRNVKQIKTVEDNRVDFTLDRPDNGIGFALASPAASIVDRRQFAQNEVETEFEVTKGSGPYVMGSHDQDEVYLVRNNFYRGYHSPLMAPMVVKTLPNPAAAKSAMDDGSVDVVADAVPTSELPALESQMGQSKEGTTESGYTMTRVENARNQQLLWNPKSPKREDAALRAHVVGATAALRTVPSVLPERVTKTDNQLEKIPGVEHKQAPQYFPMGQAAGTDAAGELTLGFDPRLPDAEPLAGKVKQALESGSVKVTLAPDDPNADLTLFDHHPFSDTPQGWLQPWLDDPLPGQEQANLTLMDDYAGSMNQAERDERLDRVLAKAAEDATLVPLTSAPETFWFGKDLEMWIDYQYGPSYQLALWGIKTP